MGPKFRSLPSDAMVFLLSYIVHDGTELFEHQLHPNTWETNKRLKAQQKLVMFGHLTSKNDAWIKIIPPQPKKLGLVQSPTTFGDWSNKQEGLTNTKFWKKQMGHKSPPIEVGTKNDLSFWGTVGLANPYVSLKPKVEPQTLGFEVFFNAGKFKWRDFRAFFLMSLQEPSNNDPDPSNNLNHHHTKSLELNPITAALNRNLSSGG